MRAPRLLVEAAEMIGTAPLIDAAVGPARPPSVALSALSQAEATVAVAAAGYKNPFGR